MKQPKTKEEFLSIVEGRSSKELIEDGLHLWNTINTLAKDEPTIFSGPMPQKREVDQNILLIPHAWYDMIPDGFMLVDIFGKEEVFVHGKTSDDHRGGYLAYGVLRPVGS